MGSTPNSDWEVFDEYPGKGLAWPFHPRRNCIPVPTLRTFSVRKVLETNQLLALSTDRLYKSSVRSNGTSKKFGLENYLHQRLTLYGARRSLLVMELIQRMATYKLRIHQGMPESEESGVRKRNTSYKLAFAERHPATNPMHRRRSSAIRT